MPKEPVSKPNGGSTPTSSSELVRVNVNSSLKIRKSPTDSTLVDWLWKDEVCVRLEKGTEKINGTYWDKVLKSNGMEGYTARETFDYEENYKLYLVPINTGGNDSNNDNNSNNDETSKIKGDVNLDGKITASDYVNIKNYIMETKQLTGQAKENADANGDGKITAGDYVVVKNKIMNS